MIVVEGDAAGQKAILSSQQSRPGLELGDECHHPVGDDLELCNVGRFAGVGLFRLSAPG